MFLAIMGVYPQVINNLWRFCAENNDYEAYFTLPHNPISTSPVYNLCIK